MSTNAVSKVGRHRIYSNEQRKDRNRKAQAAFRSRRSEYTKNLEAALLEFENRVTDLKTSNTHLEERARTAETQCAQLTQEINSLHKLLELALSTHQQQVDPPVVLSLNTPLPPMNNCPVLDMPSPESLLDSTTFDYSWLNTGESSKDAHRKEL